MQQHPVRTRAANVEAMAEPWPLIDALLGGTFAMRKAGKQFLPRFPREDDPSYTARLNTATLFPAYERTVSILVGKPFSKPVTIGEDVPPRIRELLDDVDLEGRNLHTFAAFLAADMLGFGLGGILVDCPPNPAVLSGRTPSLAEEKALGVRPYFVHIRPQQLLGFRTTRINGRIVLTQLRLLENVEIEDGAFAVKTIEQVRVLEPGAWQLWRKATVDGRETWTVHEEGATTLDFIPFVPFYGLRLGYMTGRAPMLELAHANVEHWQSKSDQQTILHVARCPVLFARGLGASEVVIGAHSMIQTEEPNADVKYVEHSGAAIEAGRVSLLDLEDRMRQAGAELLVIKPGNTTTVQVHAENEQAKCDLQRMIEALEDGLDRALGMMAAWLRIGTEGGHVSVYSDFGVTTLAEASAQMLFGMQQAGALSHETLLNELKRRGTLAPEVDPAKEIAAASAEHEAKQEAELQRQERINA